MNIALILDELSSEAKVAEDSLKLFQRSLDELGYDYSIFNWPSMKDNFLSNYHDFDLWIPIIHWGIWEWWQVTAICELLWIPVLFSTHKAHAICYDKYYTNLILKNCGIVVPSTFLIKSLSDLQKISFSWPFFVKPNTWWSSIGCGVFDTMNQASELIEAVLQRDSVLVQGLIKGRELTVSLKGNKGSPEVLGIMEVETEREFFDYDAKYKLDKTKEFFPLLNSSFEGELISISKKIYKELWLSDLARIDYIYADNKLYFLEVNTIPWMTKNSFFPKCVKHFGYKSFAEFLDELIKEKIR